MLTAVIIDDDIHAINTLKHMLRATKSVELVGHSKNFDGALDLIKTRNPEIVFLDMELAGGKGFELVKQFENPSFDIICVTGYPDYAIEAIKNMVTDYLLKPVNHTELNEAIRKCEHKKNQTKDQSLEVSPDDLNVDKISLNTNKGIEFFLIQEIVRLEASGNYCTVFLTSGRKIVTSKTLKYFEQVLQDFGFVRINRQDLVQQTQIKSMSKGRYPNLHLYNNEILKVSDRKRKELRSLLQAT